MHNDTRHRPQDPPMYAATHQSTREGLLHAGDERQGQPYHYFCRAP